MTTQYALQVLQGKDYVTCRQGNLLTLSQDFERMTDARRIVLVSKARALRPSYRKPATRRADHRSRAAICSAYVDWAIKAGLKELTVYAGDAHVPGFTCREVPVEEFLGPAPDAVVDNDSNS